jgi:hypothetical protein
VDAILLVSDVSLLLWFEWFRGWLNDVKQYGPDSVLAALIGNKLDRAACGAPRRHSSFCEDIGADGGRNQRCDRRRAHDSHGEREADIAGG